MLYMLAADVPCGENLTIPGAIVEIIRVIIFLIQVAVPILLIVYGMWDLGKAVVSQKEDEIKKGQQTFIKRLAAAILVFFVVTITKFVISFIGDITGDIEGGFWDCAQNIISDRAS